MEPQKHAKQIFINIQKQFNGEMITTGYPYAEKKKSQPKLHTLLENLKIDHKVKYKM